MSDSRDLKVSKWPFLLGWLLLLAAAGGVLYKAHRPMTEMESVLMISAVALGAIIGCLPYILDYKAAGKLVEVNALGSVMDQMRDLKKYSEQIASATDQWARVQETTKGHSDRTITMAKDITERMAQEIKEFNEFQAKLNDMEKGALRLEVDKLRRTEGDWLQVVVRMLDHIFVLYTAALRSGQPDLAEQIGNFQTACRDAARRVGLVPFGLEADETFDPKRHRAAGVENPEEDATIDGLLAPGITFQGRLIRPALVKLAGETGFAPTASVTQESTGEKVEAKPEPTKAEETAKEQFTLEPEEN